MKEREFFGGDLDHLDLATSTSHLNRTRGRGDGLVSVSAMGIRSLLSLSQPSCDTSFDWVATPPETQPVRRMRGSGSGTSLRSPDMTWRGWRRLHLPPSPPSSPSHHLFISREPGLGDGQAPHTPYMYHKARKSANPHKPCCPVTGREDQQNPVILWHGVLPRTLLPRCAVCTWCIGVCGCCLDFLR